MKNGFLFFLGFFIFLLFSSFGFAESNSVSKAQINITNPELSGSRLELNSEFYNGDQYYYYDFGQVPVNTSRSARFTLTSTGSQPLYINNVQLYGQGFFSNSNCPFVLPPGCRCEAWVDFRPWCEGNYNGQLIFSTNAGNYIVNLCGWGVRW